MLPLAQRFSKWKWTVIILLAFAFSTHTTTALAFTRGLSSKIRALQNRAYDQRLANARDAFAAHDYKKSVQEAQLALPHASNDALARPVHELLASAYKKLGDATSAAPHLAWLKK